MKKKALSYLEASARIFTCTVIPESQNDMYTCKSNLTRQILQSAHNWEKRNPCFFMRTAIVLIRLGGCPGSFESYHGALLVILSRTSTSILCSESVGLR